MQINEGANPSNFDISQIIVIGKYMYNFLYIFKFIRYPINSNRINFIKLVPLSTVTRLLFG